MLCEGCKKRTRREIIRKIGNSDAIVKENYLLAAKTTYEKLTRPFLERKQRLMMRYASEEELQCLLPLYTSVDVGLMHLPYESRLRLVDTRNS